MAGAVAAAGAEGKRKEGRGYVIELPRREEKVLMIRRKRNLISHILMQNIRSIIVNKTYRIFFIWQTAKFHRPFISLERLIIVRS